MRTILLAMGISCVTLTGCSPKRTFEVRWERTTTGRCAGAGIDPSYASETELTLRYVKAPNHFHVLCSSTLAAKLGASGKNTTTMVERLNTGYRSSTSICEIAGMKNDAPGGAVCTFVGQVSSGFENSADPQPWD